MNHVIAIAKKELRGYFRSPVAIIFLGVYLAFSLFTFFWAEQFFARNIADLRPLFSWLPVLLVFLCSALTMRQWSEEQKMGTLEVLLTLPVKLHHLVLGKFFASLALVSLALALTLPVPIMVAMNGDLDLGPVIGGYVGAVLLAGAYLAVGLYISALTDNQIVALIGSALACGLLWLIGSEPLLRFFGNESSELLGLIGTGSRFESVRRGVLDIRDLAYYGSLVALFLTLNTLTLAAKGWSDGERTRSKRREVLTTGSLIAANAVLLNFVLAPVSALRIDMTERGEYSISSVTKDLVGGLPEPLLIRGYFSEKTHPLLAPMVPRIRDTIEEYGLLGGKIRTEFLDPQKNPDVEREANQLFGIKSFPFRIADAREQAVRNSYFSVLVKYGDEFEVLNFDDLIEVQGSTMQSVEVRLRNLEYDLTRAVKKVGYGFQSLEAVFARMESPARLTAFISAKEKLPPNYAEVPERARAVLDELKKEAKGKFEFEMVDPEASGDWNPQRLYETYGLRPFAASLLSAETFYLHLVLSVGDDNELIVPSEALTEADIKKEVVAALKRGTPGFLKTIGLAKPDAPDYSNLPPQIRAQMPPAPPDLTRTLRQQLSQTYTVDEVDLKEGRVSGAVDVLMVYAPENYDEKQAYAVDQHLMRGGTVIVLGGRYDFDPQGGQGISVKKVTTGLEDVLEKYGLRLEDSMVMDPQNEPIPVPVERDLGGLRVREIQYLPYPFFVDVRRSGMAKDSPVLAGLSGVIVPWASPIVVTPPSGDDAPERTYVELLRSTEAAWSRSGTQVQPDLRSHPKLGFPVGDDAKQRTLAVLVTGTFESAFSGKGAPEGVGASLIERSPSSARLVLVGSAAFASDVIMQLSQQAQSNLQLAQNLVDWGLEDTELLSIRSRGTFARTLVPLDEAATTRLIWVTSLVCLLGLAAVVIVSAVRRRGLSALALDESRRRGVPNTAPVEVNS